MLMTSPLKMDVGLLSLYGGLFINVYFNNFKLLVVSRSFFIFQKYNLRLFICCFSLYLIRVHEHGRYYIHNDKNQIL